MIRLRGMTWDHRRATEPLFALDRIFKERRPDVEIVWAARPLSGFEFDPIERLAAENDLIVYDHPFCGRIAARRCLLSATEIVQGAGGERAFVGPSVASYRFADGDWAIPVDAACQVAAFRSDLLSRIDAAVPRTWDEVCDLGQRCRARGLSLAIGLRGVHALMTLFSLCANLGQPLAGDDRPWSDTPAIGEALAQMRRLVAICNAPVLDWNSIEVQEALSASDAFVYCPAVYGFAAYGEADRTGRLAFGAFPGLNAAAPYAGATIGGAGLGVSARVAEDPARHEAALAYARLAAEPAVQRGIFARHHGQPAHVAVWQDADTDAAFNGFFSGTRQTMEQCWIRPRYDGYLAFQARAGDLIEAHLRGDIGEPTLRDTLCHLDAECRAERSE